MPRGDVPLHPILPDLHFVRMPRSWKIPIYRRLHP